ncbi:hypothetical protein CCACVL1_06063 [Corchorus capsularis]|uniref:Uncharacterized protein n=1 Tax=Corchorus capsularis TaxID=210143 RepID=A0A1R3JHH0_COCAP|nr:hypothetical protein CCACVL1_06063 [Corchorus capsularis]
MVDMKQDKRMHIQLHTAEFNTQRMSIKHTDTGGEQIRLSQNSMSASKGHGSRQHSKYRAQKYSSHVTLA